MHEALISSLVANGMAHSAGAFEQWQELGKAKETLWMRTGSQSEYAEAKGPPGRVFVFQGSSKGYAWSMDGTPVKLSVAVLVLYCVYVSVYVLYTFLTGHSSMAWSSISELVALAVNSMPTPSMDNTRGGISRTETLQTLVTVREVEKHQRLELVFPEDRQDRGPTKRVSWNVAY